MKNWLECLAGIGLIYINQHLVYTMGKVSRWWHYNSCVLYFWSIKAGLAVKYDCQP